MTLLKQLGEAIRKVNTNWSKRKLRANGCPVRP
jgi:hypothetical protein